MLPKLKIDLSEDDIVFIFEFNYELKEKIKKIPGVHWDKPRWKSAISNYSKIIEMLPTAEISDALKARIQKIQEQTAKIAEIKASKDYKIVDYNSKKALFKHQNNQLEIHRILRYSACFSEMGAGKTASAICAIDWRIKQKQVKKCLVVCPLSIVPNWREELERFSDLSFVDLVGPKTQRLKKLDYDKQVYIINYEGLRIIEKDLLKKDFQMVVCDEAHRLKNSFSKQSQSAYSLGGKAFSRIALTGSNVQNSLEDAFGILTFIDPSVFGKSYYAFRNRYFKNVGFPGSTIPIYIPRANAEEEISDKLASVSIRYLKEECLDLPEFQDLPDRRVQLSDEQDKAYENLLNNLIIELENKDSIKIDHVLTVFIKLSQITSGFIKIPSSEEKESEEKEFKSNPKFDELNELVEECGSRPVILWGYFRHDIDLMYNYYSRCRKCKFNVNDVVEKECPKCKTVILYRASVIHGGIKHRNFEINRFRLTEAERANERQKMENDGADPKDILDKLGEKINDCEPPQTSVFCLQLTSGSEGLNLQRANMNIYYSLNYSSKDYQQSRARTHRSGQTKTVSYVNLVCQRSNGEETIDSKIIASLKKKELLSRKVNKDDLKKDLKNIFGSLLNGKEKLLDKIENLETNEDLIS